MHEAADGIGAALQFRRAQPVEVANKRDEVGAGFASGREELVECATDRMIIGEQRALLAGRCDRLDHVGQNISNTA
jgi:hypothetical protein